MIHSLTITGKLRDRFPLVKPGKLVFRFAPGVNVLAGPNGSGKSTLLRAIRDNSRDIRAKADLCRTRYLDFERQNPRVQGHLADGIEMFQIASQFRSHGETTRPMFAEIAKPGFRDSVALLDEPDQALDMAGIAELLSALRRSPARQVLISAHDPGIVLGNEFNVIELQPGYGARMRAHLVSLLATPARKTVR